MTPFVGMFFRQRWLLTWLSSTAGSWGRSVLGVNTPAACEKKSKKGLVTQHGLSDLAAVKSPFLSSALTSAQHLGPQGGDGGCEGAGQGGGCGGNCLRATGRGGLLRGPCPVVTCPRCLWTVGTGEVILGGKAVCVGG